VGSVTGGNFALSQFITPADKKYGNRLWENCFPPKIYKKILQRILGEE